MQAQQVLSHIKRRLAQCRLDVHPEKTHIVYCKDDDRPGQYPTEQFTFLGYTFRARRSKNRWGKYFINFAPAVSNAAATRMRQAMRRRHLPRRSDKAIDDLARMWNGCGSSSWTVFAPIHRGLRSRTVPLGVVLRGSGVGPGVHRLTFAQAARLNPPGRFGSVPRQRAGLDILQAFW